MSHDVFISFSSVNTDVAEKTCAFLEESGNIKCWIAFRDIVPSANYAEQLVEAIESCKLVLLILSDDSNSSPQVSREIERAGSKGIPILPLRIEDVELSKSMEYFISSHHWLDAFESDIEDFLPALKTAVESSILGKSDSPSGTDADTRKSAATQQNKGIQPQMIFGAALVLTILIVAMFFTRQDQSQVTETPHPQPAPSVEKETITQPVSPRDALIQELAQRFRQNKTVNKPASDGWTSKNPISIAFLDISGAGVNDAQKDFILNRTAEKLQHSGRYSIVEREIISKLLEELNLSSSALADPATSLKLGRILSAGLIVTGSISQQDEQWLANLRFIETETTSIKFTVSTLVEKGGPEEVISDLTKAIDNKLPKAFPLQAKITSVSGENAEINIGLISGVTQGMTFALLQENDMPINLGTVTTVERQQSYISLANNTIPVEEGMRLREQVRE